MYFYISVTIAFPRFSLSTGHGCDKQSTNQNKPVTLIADGGIRLSSSQPKMVQFTQNSIPFNKESVAIPLTTFPMMVPDK